MLIKCVTFNYKTIEHEWSPPRFSSLQQKDYPTEQTIWFLSSDVEQILQSLSKPNRHLQDWYLSGPHLVKYFVEVLVLKIPCWIPPARDWDLQALGTKYCSWKGYNLRKKSSVWAVLISNLINKTILHLWSYIVCTVWCLHTFIRNWLFPICPSAQQHQKLQQFCLLHQTSAVGIHVCTETQIKSFIGSSP